MQSKKTYESKRPCVKCGSVERYRSNHQCVPCKKVTEKDRYLNNRNEIIGRNAKWAEENKEKTRIYKENYKARNPAKVAESKRAYEDKNRDRVKKAKALWWERNPGYQSEYRAKNKERIEALGAAWRKKNSGRIMERVRKWREDNIEHARAMEADRRRKWRKTPEGKAVTFMRGSIRRCLHVRGEDERTYEAIGYHPKDLIEHIEKQFKRDMSWNNYGDKWVIDHITPVAEFIRSGVVDPKIVNFLSNLRPFCKIKNMEKSDKVEFLL